MCVCVIDTKIIAKNESPNNEYEKEKLGRRCNKSLFK